MTNTNKLPTEHYQQLSEFISKRKFASSHECPISKAEFNWLFKQRESNGFAKAFVKVNSRKFLVHIPTFIRCLSERRGA